MGYYVRAFCKSATVPTIAAVEGALRSRLPNVRLQTPEAPDSNVWKDVELHYKDRKQPVVVEINVNEGPGSLVAEECQEFVDELEALEEPDATARVIEHLRSTHFTVCSQLLSDIDDEGYEANGELLNYFLKHHQGIIQADGEGFYDGPDLIVELK